jgi:hypothetical protein
VKRRCLEAVLLGHLVEQFSVGLPYANDFDVVALSSVPEQALDVPVHQTHDGEAERAVVGVVEIDDFVRIRRGDERGEHKREDASKHGLHGGPPLVCQHTLILV